MNQVKVTANSVLYVVATDNCKLFLKDRGGYLKPAKLTGFIRQALMFDDEKDAKLEAEELGLKVYKFYLEHVPTNSRKFEENSDQRYAVTVLALGKGDKLYFMGDYGDARDEEKNITAEGGVLRDDFTKSTIFLLNGSKERAERMGLNVYMIKLDEV
ncbi:hypothetical protein GTO87_02845 [Ligilactobacillus saerimneri]|uniref:Uncharacterized protein n=1 Tax=Ligilactobacillus saerimneri TaxID=228229 RepID=A0A7H9EIU4_9LACO|nr:hypothetical protein [Ligilactobacillus saerimneri]QLL77628.1 hypothetical protein GTO87_02845 [Ligilactobacillus saerimneri]